MKPYVISLFCGAGGLDEGFRQAGFGTSFAFDNSPAAIDTFNKNHKGNAGRVVDLGALRTAQFVEYLRQTKGRKANIKGIIGGPPCQGVSEANSSASPNDPRNSLMTTYIRLLNAAHDEVGLEFFVFENVPGLLRKANEARFTRLKHGLSRHFHVGVLGVDAKNYGVPQERKRVLILGLAKRKFRPEDLPTLNPKAINQTVRDVLFGLPEPALFAKCLTPEQIGHHPNHWTMKPRSAKFQGNALEHTHGRSFQKLEWDKPSRTVAYGHREIHIHPNGHRRLSIFEAMLLQGFPVGYQLLGTLSQQVTQISNAVPPPLAKIVAKQFMNALRSQNE